MSDNMRIPSRFVIESQNDTLAETEFSNLAYLIASTFAAENIGKKVKVHDRVNKETVVYTTTAEYQEWERPSRPARSAEDLVG